MILYVTFLRFLATCLITNSHYGNIYPLSIIANGGLLGDLLFFSVSGFCLAEIRLPFYKWYAKRLCRIYPAVWLITILYALMGVYTVAQGKFVELFVYPTAYHFVASIVILYIIYYLAIKIPFVQKHFWQVMLAEVVVWLGIYFTVYDRSYYHIDNVHEPMIRFLYFDAMMLGWYFRKRKTEVSLPKIGNWMVLFLLFVSYFVSKLAFVRYEKLALLQIVNQVILFLLVYSIWRCLAGMDVKLKNMPRWLWRIINYISGITLEIYVVQYVIIDQFENWVFPVNWLVVTAVIVIAASILHVASQYVTKLLDRMIGV